MGEKFLKSVVYEMTTKVFIFGAGASKPAGALLLKEFFPVGMFHLISGDPFPDRISNYPNFLDFLKKHHGFDPQSSDPYKSDPIAFAYKEKIDIENILSSIHKEIDKGKHKLSPARREAEAFVYRTLENAVRDGSTNNCYPAFVLKKIKNLSSNEYIFITFNYETLFERALSNEFRGYFSYGIPVDRDRVINFPSYESNYNNLLILKLHGSLNWAVCLKCNKIHLLWSQKYDHIFKKPCMQCKTQLEAILIPPTEFKTSYLEKNGNVANLKNLWKIAKEKIISANEITIIGYSLSDYDVKASNLIIDSIKSNKESPKFYIVDPNAKSICDKIISKKSLDKKHFKEIRLFNGFKEYLDSIP